MKQLLLSFLALAIFSCSNEPTKKEGTAEAKTSGSTAATTAESTGGKYKGTFSNGMKGATISFEVSDDGKELKDLIFEGYWRCDGKLDLTTIGPDKSYTIENGKVDGVITEPKSSIRSELHASFSGNKAQGTLRISIVPLACDTYVLNWTAEKQ